MSNKLIEELLSIGYKVSKDTWPAYLLAESVDETFTYDVKELVEDIKNMFIFPLVSKSKDIDSNLLFYICIKDNSEELTIRPLIFRYNEAILEPLNEDMNIDESTSGPVFKDNNRFFDIGYALGKNAYYNSLRKIAKKCNWGHITYHDLKVNFTKGYLKINCEVETGADDRTLVFDTVEDYLNLVNLTMYHGKISTRLSNKKRNIMVEFIDNNGIVVNRIKLLSTYYANYKYKQDQAYMIKLDSDKYKQNYNIDTYSEAKVNLERIVNAIDIIRDLHK